MDLNKAILEEKEEYYNLAIKNYYNINTEEFNNVIRSIVPKSISVLIDHPFIPTPCLEIKIELHHKETQNEVGYYFIYIDENKELIDEFLISNW
jgi:hypothetical protein